MSVALAVPRGARKLGVPRFSAKVVAAIMLVALADLLFYDRAVGISLLLFTLVMTAAIVLSTVPWSRWSPLLPPAVVLAVAVLPLIEDVTPVSVILALTAISAFTLAITGRLRSGISGIAKQVCGFIIAVPFRFVPDLVRWRRVAHKKGGRARFAWIAAWVLPIGLGTVFVLLFAAANPVVEQWLDMIELWRLLDLLELTRMAFWLLILLTVWGFLRPRISWFQRPRPVIDLIGPPRPAPVKREYPVGDAVLGETAIFRALVLFNALFAVETVLDIAYLWGGVALPDGMTYAAYAHRGAYPLILTALLAAAFVLGATREGSASAGNPVIRVLIYVWTAQNILLVASSMLRLDLYVSIYSLTYWRVAAFIWMGLVAIGLGLIIARIAFGKSNDWLLGANLLTLSATLYACGFINFAALIANYNVDHRPAWSDTTVQLDTWYLMQLGPHAIPAIDRLLADKRTGYDPEGYLRQERDRLIWELGERMGDWRGWTFRDWRLIRYLDGHPAPTIQTFGDGFRER